MRGRVRRAVRISRFAAGAVLGLAAALLGACGFRLQGSQPMPAVLAVAYVQAADSQTDFVQSLRKSLLASGSRLTEQREQATAVVQVLTDRVEERVLSVSARNLPREFELIHTVRFRVSAAGQEILPAQEIMLSRDFSFDERALLAKENEEAILREALARDLVGIVIRRLASL